MGEPIRALARVAVLVTFASVAMLGAVLAPAGAADPPVVQGPWTIKATYQSGDTSVDFAAAKWRLSFGQGCATGTVCTVDGSTGIDDATSMALQPGAGGFRFTAHLALDCFDTVTGELRTVHGADYDLTATLSPSSVEQVGDTSYVTALTGTLVEDIVVNAKGRADNCTASGALEQHKVSTLSGTADKLPAPPAGTSSTPVGVGPASADTSGTIPGFTLPLDDEAARSVAAVSADRRSSVPGAVTVPSEALRTASDRLPQDLLLVALLGLLMVFPAQIFNSTYEENHERIARVTHRFRRRRGPVATAAPVAAPGRARRVAVFLVSAAVGTVLGGLLDPGFGVNRTTAALLVGVFVALLLAVAVATVAGWTFRAARHRPHGWYLRAIPGGLVVAVCCVLVSRLTDFAPGYLYGLLGGAVFASVLEKKSEGRAEAVTLVAGLVVALGAWVAFEPVAHAANAAEPHLGVLVADSVLGCLFIGGIEGMLFALIPLRFLPGHRVKQWGWIPWALLTGLTLYVFVHVLLTPASGYLGRSTSGTTNVTVALFIAFGVLSMAFWAWFRFRPEKTGIPGPSTGSPEDGVIPVSVSVPGPAVAS